MSDKGDIRQLPVAIDFDGVIAESIWPDRGIGPIISKNVEKIRALRRAGHIVAVHTSRPWSDKDVLQKWLLANDIPFDDINCGKYLACMYVDDKAINSEAESWL